MFAAFLSTILFSVSVISGSRSARLIGGTEANFWRLTVAGILLGTWSFGFGRGLGGEAFPVFVLSGIVGIGGGDVALFQALPRLGARLSMLLIQCLTAPMAALVEWYWLGTRLTASQAGCIALVLTGVGLALTPSEHTARPRRVLMAGALCCVVAAAGGAMGAVLSRKAYVVAQFAAQPLDGANAAFQRVVGGLFLAGLCLLAVKRQTFRVQSKAPHQLILETSKQKWRGVWPYVLLNGLAGQTLGVSSMQWALETTPTGIVLAIIALTPVVVIPFSWRFEGERPTPRSLAGALIAVAGVIGLALSR